MNKILTKTKKRKHTPKKKKRKGGELTINGVKWELKDDYIDVTFIEKNTSINLVQNSIMYVDSENVHIDTNSGKDIIRRAATKLLKGGNIMHLIASTRDEKVGGHIYIAPPRIIGNLKFHIIPANQSFMLSQNYYIASSQNIIMNMLGGDLLKQIILHTGTKYFEMKNTEDNNGIVVIAATGNVIEFPIESGKSYRINNDLLIGWTRDVTLNANFNPIGGGLLSVTKKIIKSRVSNVGMMIDVSGEGTVFLESRRNPFKKIVTESSSSSSSAVNIIKNVFNN